MLPYFYFNNIIFTLTFTISFYLATFYNMWTLFYLTIPYLYINLPYVYLIYIFLFDLFIYLTVNTSPGHNPRNRLKRSKHPPDTNPRNGQNIPVTVETSYIIFIYYKIINVILRL